MNPSGNSFRNRNDKANDNSSFLNRLPTTHIPGADHSSDIHLGLEPWQFEFSSVTPRMMKI
jgi:hypothetical protein